MQSPNKEDKNNIEELCSEVASGKKCGGQGNSILKNAELAFLK